MRSRVLIVFVTAAFLLTAVPPGGSAQGSSDLRFTGNQLPDCDPAAAELMCWGIEGDLEAAFVAGREVTITVVAPGEAPHNLYFIADGEQDGTTYDTDGSAAIASSETVQHGNETTFSFTVPTDVEALYYWCDVGLPVADEGGDHELAGMRGTVNVTAAADEDSDDASDGDGDGDGESDGDDAGSDNGTSEDNGTADGNTTAEDDEGDGSGDEAGNTTTGAGDASGAEAGADNDTKGAEVQAGESARALPLPVWTGLVALGGVAAAVRRRRS